MPPAEKSPSGRRIFSRIASPFTSTSRTIADFSVKPTDEHKTYSPGDIVTGHVRLRVAKPIRITHIVVCLHGFVQVYKTPGSPGEGFRANNGYLGTGRGKKKGEYFGNGFASLFEDEEVLCGDGRLAEGEYQFNFELEFPDRGLPSSIDFERGTISYMITATLTRPNAMSPMITCDRKIHFAEVVDISPLYPPKPRTITLEPVSRRGRTRNSARKLVNASNKSRSSTSVQQQSDTTRQSEASSVPSTRADSRGPGSPVPSEISFGSRFSNNRRMSQADSESQDSPSSTPTPSEAGRCNASRLSLADKVITASIESQAGGCLQGDYIPVKVNISHTKQVKSMYGVILTLYRQARVDMRPAIPLGPIEKGKDAKYEEYYPKSLTGLGGLSLSGAGSTHVFRKDLSQSISPLYIDLQTLTVEVNAKVRVPDEAFPTISTVPGSMISFKYYVEVIVDIQGKLQGQEKSANNLSGQAPPLGHYLNSEVSDMERSAFTPFGSTVIDTASVRRDKGVVTCTFEVVIGTKDSERRKGKRKLETPAQPEEPPPSSPTQDQSVEDQNSAYPAHDWYGADYYYDQHWYGGHYPYYYVAPDQWHSAYQEQGYHLPPPPLIPIPQMPDESHMTEKERIQQAETRLLPSQPPGQTSEQEDSTTGATAPFLPEESDSVLAETPLPAVPEYGIAGSSSAAQALGRRNTVDQPKHPVAPLESIPAMAAPPQAAAAASNDEQETRYSLSTEVPAAPVDADENAGVDSSAADHNPSVAAFNELAAPSRDEHDSHADAAGLPELPRYEQ